MIMGILKKTNRQGEVMIGLSLNALLLLFLLIFTYEIYADPPGAFTPHMDESVERKLDPSILMELEGLKEQKVSKPLKIIVRTKGNMNDVQRKQIEEVGLTIGSILGDVFTATGPLTAVLKAARFDFVSYIELSRKLEQK
jgi:hypothetical protein